jgi:hypothetical protein
MRSRLFLAAIAACATLATTAAAQGGSEPVGDPMAGGFSAGDYLRLSGGLSRPINPQGTLRDWKQGTSFSLTWENWGEGNPGVSSVGFGLGVGYSMLPLDEQAFVSSFSPPSGVSTRSATAGQAGILEITTNIRIRIPAPLVMPAFNLGFGFIDWLPASVQYVGSDNVAGTARYAHRSGAEVSLGGSLERQLFDRYGIFGEAAYTYGYTSYGQGFATPGSTCARGGCDALKNTTFAIVRGGVRVGLWR